jgi:hypothetical protein
LDKGCGIKNSGVGNGVPLFIDQIEKRSRLVASIDGAGQPGEKGG